MNVAHRAVRRLLLPGLVVAAGISVSADAWPESRTLDKGSFVISIRGRAVGREDFTLVEAQDSLIVNSSSTITRRTPDGDKEIRKLLNLVVGREDFALRAYTSNEQFDGHVRVRNVLLGSPTAITLVHELDGRGFSDTYERPPGRFYVVEAQLYSLISLIGHSLREQSFDRRPVNIVSLAQRDTISEAEIVRLPAETIRWGNKPVQADHLQFVQAPVTIDLWMDKLGRVLLIEHVPSGLRVEREARKVKPRPKSPNPSG